MNNIILAIIILCGIGILSLVFSLVMLIKIKLNNEKYDRNKNQTAVLLLICALLWLILAGFLWINYNHQLTMPIV